MESDKSKINNNFFIGKQNFNSKNTEYSLNMM
jgi:hypothetical protein